MPDADLVKRIEMLEENLKSLGDVPVEMRVLERRMTGVEVQILQLRTEMRDEFSAMRSDMATKQDLSGLATKQDLTRLATKQDLTGLATKQDLTQLATKQELADGLAAVRAEMATKKDLERLVTKDLAALKTELREDIAGMGRDLAAVLLDFQRHNTLMLEDIRSLIQVRNEGTPPRSA